MMLLPWYHTDIWRRWTNVVNSIYKGMSNTSFIPGFIVPWSSLLKSSVHGIRAFFKSSLKELSTDLLVTFFARLFMMIHQRCLFFLRLRFKDLGAIVLDTTEV